MENGILQAVKQMKEESGGFDHSRDSTIQRKEILIQPDAVLNHYASCKFSNLYSSQRLKHFFTAMTNSGSQHRYRTRSTF
jgi:hypothetical protein